MWGHLIKIAMCVAAFIREIKIKRTFVCNAARRSQVDIICWTRIAREDIRQNKNFTEERGKTSKWTRENLTKESSDVM
jgi:hypothetical protein